MIKKIADSLYKISKKHWERFGVDLPYFIKNGFWLLISHMVTVLKWLAIVVLLTQFLGVNLYGEYSFIVSLLGIVWAFGLSGAWVSTMQSVARGFEGTYRFLLRKTLLFGLAWSLLLFSIAAYLKLFQNYENYGVLIALALFYPLYAISNSYSAYLTGVKKFDLRAKYEFIANLIILIATVSILFFVKDTWILIVLLMLCQTIPYAFVAYTLANEANDSIDESSFPYALKLSLLGIPAVIKTFADKIIVSAYMGFAQTGLYSLSLAINDQLYAFGKILGNLLMPKTANLSKTELQKHLKKMVLTTFLIFLSASIALILVYPFAIPFFFWEEFRNAIRYSQMLTGFVTIKSTFIVMQFVDNSQKELKSTIFSSTVSPVAEIILMILLGYFFQIYGIIFAKIIGDFMNLGYFLFTKKTTVSKNLGVKKDIIS